MRCTIGCGVAVLLLASCTPRAPRLTATDREAVVRSAATAWVDAAVRRHDLDGIAEPREGWVVGDEPSVSPHFLDADHHAR